VAIEKIASPEIRSEESLGALPRPFVVAAEREESIEHDLALPNVHYMHACSLDQRTDLVDPTEEKQASACVAREAEELRHVHMRRRARLRSTRERNDIEFVGSGKIASKRGHERLHQGPMLLGLVLNLTGTVAVFEVDDRDRDRPQSGVFRMTWFEPDEEETCNRRSGRAYPWSPIERDSGSSKQRGDDRAEAMTYHEQSFLAEHDRSGSLGDPARKTCHFAP
jgi:hypothetical protein